MTQTVALMQDECLSMVLAVEYYHQVVIKSYICAKCSSEHSGGVLAVHPQICSATVYNACPR